MSTYKPGEFIDVTVRGVRVLEETPGGRVVIADEHGDPYAMPPQAAVERVAPAEWPPRPGDLWRDRDDALWFACSYMPDYDDANDSKGIDESGTRTVLLPQITSEGTAPGHYHYRPEQVVRAHGPLSLVHREDAEQDGAA